MPIWYVCYHTVPDLIVMRREAARTCTGKAPCLGESPWEGQGQGAGKRHAHGRRGQGRDTVTDIVIELRRSYGRRQVGGQGPWHPALASEARYDQDIMAMKRWSRHHEVNVASYKAPCAMWHVGPRRAPPRLAPSRTRGPGPATHPTHIPPCPARPAPTRAPSPRNASSHPIPPTP